MAKDVIILQTTAGLPDANFIEKDFLQITGGEAKFGDWRHYANVYEKDYCLTYNCEFDPDTNSFVGRDSGNVNANIAVAQFLNVAEGNSGQNCWNLIFAPGAAQGVDPDFNAGAWYTMYDGKTGAGPVDARFKIRGAADMGAVLQLVAHETVSPSDWAVKSDPGGTLQFIKNYSGTPDIAAAFGATNLLLKPTNFTDTVNFYKTGAPPFTVSSTNKVANLRAERVEELATASLPTAGSAEDGRLIIEQVSANEMNVVAYTNGKRFRWTGWVEF